MVFTSSYQVSQQRDLTVIVTDSGIGGVGIAAQVYCALKTEGAYDNVRVIYYNALFDDKSGAPSARGTNVLK